jgi:hypothetical protein
LLPKLIKAKEEVPPSTASEDEGEGAPKAKPKRRRRQAQSQAEEEEEASPKPSSSDPESESDSKTSTFKHSILDLPSAKYITQLETRVWKKTAAHAGEFIGILYDDYHRASSEIFHIFFYIKFFTYSFIV